MKNKPKLIRITTVPISLHKLLQGQIEYMEKNGFEVVLASADGEEIKQIELETGLKVNKLPFTRKITPFTDLKALWQVYRFFKKEKPDIVHSITPKAGLLSMIAAYFAGVPVRMHTFTGLIFPSKEGAIKKLLLNMDRVLCFFATHIYPEGEGVKNDLISYKVTKKPLKVLANGNINGIDTAFFSAKIYNDSIKKELKEEIGINNQTDFTFIFIGRLVKDKGIKELIKAFAKLQTEIQNIKLLLVGNEEPELDPLLPVTSQEIHQNSAIITTGWVDDVRPYLSIADVFVFPSYREGFPNVVMQAGAMGLPSIVTDINGSNEIITHNKNGLIIPVKDEEALYKAMADVITKERKYQQQVVWEALRQEYMLL